MSHIAEIKVEIKDLEALKLATARLGGSFLEGQNHYRWYGRWVGDTPLPADTAVEELGRCDHALRFPQCTYDVGVVKRGSGYILRWDYFSSGGLCHFLGGQEAPKLVQAYAIEKARLEALKRGHRVTETTLADGSVRLVLTSSR